ncbi:MAG: hypothetical protein J5747_05510 [Spirochaetaceae bacterium]|jgi:hypothetical protein|nr:hypothetical protein [Spirochaetaceae bacterium]MBO4705233.1 hypothetical protein [Spirochaetaceae bacterium]
MKVLELKNVHRDEGYIYYRRTFQADAVLELPLKTMQTPVEFTIELSPLGTKDIDITFLDNIDYPLLPLTKSLKEIILSKDSEGLLP